MNDDILFEANSPLGYKVQCTKERWHVHILNSEHRQEMEGRETEVANTIISPVSIWESEIPQGRHVYFGASGTAWKYTKVIVQPPNNNIGTGNFITAFVKDSIGGNIGKVIFNASNS